jgi:hypothetical protein
MTERYEALRDLEYCVDMWVNGEEAALHINTIRTIRAALQSPVPEGCVLVPREPTEEMTRRGAIVVMGHNPDNLNVHDCYSDIYKAMIEAAQKGGGDPADKV